MTYWLFKSEPDTFSIDDLTREPKKTTPWDGVRNYQARNSMRDDMAAGDLGFFYHSACTEPGVVGIVRIAKEAYPDPSASNPKSKYHDPKSTPDNPSWVAVDLKYVCHIPQYVTLKEMRRDPKLEGLGILRRGNRLSITPVSPAHFKRICQLGGLKEIPS